jgi:hypothetical protein
VFAALLDDPGQFVGFFLGQTACGPPERGFPLHPTVGV